MLRRRRSGYLTPEEAARCEIPERYATVLDVSISPDGTEAIVALGTNEEPQLYPNESICYRMRRGRWIEASSAGGISLPYWSPREWPKRGPVLGVLRFAGEAPEGAKEVIVRWGAEERGVGVAHGYFFFTEWRVPDDFEESVGVPKIVRVIRGDGTSQDVDDDGFAQIWESDREDRRRSMIDDEGDDQVGDAQISLVILPAEPEERDDS
jgi:hypothetical protein